MARGTKVPITPSVLNWAIAESGYSTEEIANRLGEPSELVLSWKNGDSVPLLSQFRRLISILKRPAATFFLPEPPQIHNIHIEFRGSKEKDRRPLNPKERQLIRQARRLQENLSWLNKEFAEKRPRLLKTTISSHVESTANDIRSDLGIGVAKQLGWHSSTEAFKEWRSTLEREGIFVFLFPIGKNSCRGFSLFDPYAPIIAVNTAWNNEARIFTLFHELGHLITRTDSACKRGGNFALTKTSDKTERWCEKFAANVLLPWNAVKRFISENYSWIEGGKIESVDAVYELANEFKVSARAAAIRLIQRQAADWALYKKIPPIADDKQGGGGGKGRVRQEISEANYGLKTAKLLIRGADEKYLTMADAIEFLRIKDTDLERFREHGR